MWNSARNMCADSHSLFHSIRQFIFSNHALTDVVLHHIACPQTHCSKPGVKVCMYSAEDVFQLLNFRNQELMLDHHVEIQKQSAIEETEAPKPEPKERTKMVSDLTEGLGHIEADVKKFEHIDSNSKQKQKIMRLFACFLPCLLVVRKCEAEGGGTQTCMFDFFKSSSGTRVSSPELLNFGDDDSADIPSVQEEVPPL